MKGTTQSALGDLLFGKTRLAILSLLFQNPDRKLYLRQILRLTGAGQGAVQRELAKLAQAGVLVKTREENLAYYRANRPCPVFGELKGLVEKPPESPELYERLCFPSRKPSSVRSCSGRWPEVKSDPRATSISWSSVMSPSSTWSLRSLPCRSHWAGRSTRRCSRRRSSSNALNGTISSSGA